MISQAKEAGGARIPEPLSTLGVSKGILEAGFGAQCVPSHVISRLKILISENIELKTESCQNACLKSKGINVVICDTRKNRKVALESAMDPCEKIALARKSTSKIKHPAFAICLQYYKRPRYCHRILTSRGPHIVAFGRLPLSRQPTRSCCRHRSSLWALSLNASCGP